MLWNCECDSQASDYRRVSQTQMKRTPDGVEPQPDGRGDDLSQLTRREVYGKSKREIFPTLKFEVEVSKTSQEHRKSADKVEVQPDKPPDNRKFRGASTTRKIPKLWPPEEMYAEHPVKRLHSQCSQGSQKRKTQEVVRLQSVPKSMSQHNDGNSITFISLISCTVW